MEKFVNRKEIYQGKVVHVVCDDVSLDDGRMAKREVVMHNGGACIALQDDDGKFLMVKQFRYALNKEMLEFCAGKLEKDEDALSAIKRECEEELGFKCNDVIALGYIIPTCGYCNEKIYLFYGKKGEYVGNNFDEDEKIEAYKYSIEEIKAMIDNGQIDDAKTIALVLKMGLKGIV